MIDLHKTDGVLKEFQEVSLSEINCVHLMERRDTKFIFKTALFLDILKDLAPYYKVLTIENHKTHPYSTTYFDTSDLLMYNHHQNGKLNRFKLRLRSYEAFNTNFLELKFKSNKQQTIKRRIEVHGNEVLPDQAINLIETETEFIFSELHESLINKFTRITLVNNEFTERLTLDFNLFFKNATQSAEYSSIVIAELKQSNTAKSSQFSDLMKNVGIRQLGISKYCLGMMLVNPGIKYNNFKSVILQIQKASL